MSADSKKKTKTKTKMNHNEYVVPKDKKQMIEYINEAGIEDIICTSNILDGELTFSLEIRTKDQKIFHFGQDVVVKLHLPNMEVLDMSTGNCHTIPAKMGKGFDASTYNYNVDSPWELKTCE